MSGNGGGGGAATGGTGGNGGRGFIGGNGGSGGLGLLLGDPLTGSVSINAAATGGNGGNGGDSVGSFSVIGLVPGGMGGQGGAGLVLNAAAGAVIELNANVTGGNGGSGYRGSSGGDGWLAMGFIGSGAKTLEINAGVTVQGGNGGAVGTPGGGGQTGTAGAGGTGIFGENLAVSIGADGVVAGGLGGDGITRAYSIVFSGGTNSAGGPGTIANGIHVQGGSFAPALAGSAIGVPMSIGGPLVFAPGAQYVVRLSPGANDSVTAAGAATLTGANVNAQFAPGSYVTRQYTILSASALVGTFNALTTGNVPAGFGAVLDYQGNDVLLVLSGQLGGGNTGSLNVNQLQVANALNNYFNNGGALPPAFFTLFGLTGESLRNALTQASGEPGASVSTSTFLAWQQMFNMIFDPFAANRGGFGGGFGGASAFAPHAQPEEVRLAYAAVTPKRDLKDAPVTKAPALADPFASRWSVWGGGYGGSAKTDGNAQIGSHDTTSRAYGFAAGADHRLAPDTLIGFALAGGGTSFGLDQGLGGGTSDMFQASVYARQNWGAAYLMGAFGYGWQDSTLNRTVTIAGTDKLEADFNAHTLAGRAEGGWRWGGPMAGITPYAAVQVTSLDLPAYTERATSGSNAFALSYAGRTDTQTRSEFGARLDYAMPMQASLLTLRGRAAWAHDYDTDRIANPTFLALPGAAFTVNGAQPDADSLLVSAGAELAFLNGFSIAGSFEGEFSGDTESYAGKGAIRYRW